MSLVQSFETTVIDIEDEQEMEKYAPIPEMEALLYVIEQELESLKNTD